MRFIQSFFAEMIVEEHSRRFTDSGAGEIKSQHIEFIS